MSEDLKHSSQRIQDLLQNYNLDIKVIEFKELTRTSKEAASVIGCEVGQIAKTLIFKGKKSMKPFCVIASGKNRVDEKKIAQFIGEEIEKPDADFVKEHTHFVIGGIPPLGYPLEDKPLIDEDLMAYQEIWAAAGTPYAVFRITPQDLVKITEARIVKIRQ
ncbi:MAG: YbaK/EbsC family protein [Rhabdochlamydiaceae bacterium]|jgi:prolyl-tRNA editing enzyme YbaK/EbsC (Cys-tRNA(Pro) deacylase)